MESKRIYNEEEIKQFHIPRWIEIPEIDLYIDQVVSLLDNNLANFIKSDNEKKERAVTKTMINNYVKNNLIEAPVKKKYSKIQCAKIFAICILKQVFSMNEIYKLIEIALKHSDVEHAYDSFCNHFEKALSCAYNKEDFLDEDTTQNDNKYLLKSVLLSCCYKIYVQNVI